MSTTNFKTNELLSRELLRRQLLLIFACIFSIAIAGKLHAQSPLDIRQSELERVEEYLVSLDLNDLVIEHLEIETDREIELKARRELARRLIDEYAERMISGLESPEKQWHQKASRLVVTYPELATPAIRIAMFQSEYLKNEKTFRQWWSSGRSAKEQAELISQWHRLNQDLQTIHQRLDVDYEDKVAALQASPEYQNLQSRQLRRIEGQLLHTEYLIGWSSYFLAILQPELRRSLMEESNRNFRSFLQIDPRKSLKEIAPEWFDFSSDWNARAVVGLGMCQRGLNHLEQSQYCFELIGNHSKDSRTRDLRYVWELNSRVYLDEVSSALELVQKVEQENRLMDSGRVVFAKATLQSSVAMQARAPLVAKRMLEFGLAALARQSQINPIREFLASYKAELDESNFVSLWVAGLISLDDAESGKGSSLVDAKKKLTLAKKSIDESTNAQDVVRLEYSLAKILFLERKYDEASISLAKSSQQLETTSPELSAEAQWLTVKSLSQLSRSNSRALIRTTRAIDSLIHRFPGSTYAKRAEFEKIRVNAVHLPTEQAIERLGRFSETNSNYPLARHEMVRVRYQDWLNAFRTKSARQTTAFNLLATSKTNYLSISGTSIESRLKVRLLFIDALIRSIPKNNSDQREIKQIEEELKKAIQVVDTSIQIDQTAIQELKYYQFILATKKNDQTTAINLANWLRENATGSRFEKSALIQLAQLADSKLRANPNPTIAQVGETAKIFESLSKILTTQGSNLKASNTQVAQLRLGELKLMMGEPNEALAIAQSLNQASPNHKMILQLLANSMMETGGQVEAIPIWQKLNRGVDAGSELWFESKYKLAICLMETGSRKEARDLHSQTIRLSPAIPSKWTKPFEDLTIALQ